MPMLSATIKEEAIGTGTAFVPPPASGSLLGAIALIAGTTVGAGILALPAKTLAAGIAPTSVTLVGAWVYMAASGLLIAEVNVNTLCATERNAVSLSTMCEETLGTAGSRLSSLAYVFIHYTLLVAYMLQGGTLIFELADELLGAGSPLLASLPPTELVGPPLYAALLGGALLLAAPSVAERANSLAVVGVIASFVVLLVLGVQQVDPVLLAHVDIPAVVPAIPVMVLSLVYHNVVPTICYQLGCDLPRIRTAIVVGSAIPALMFILWCAVVLGSVPFDAAASAAASGEVFDPLALLRGSGDAFGETRVILFALTLVPPVGFAVWDPSVFFSALDNAGTYGILTLFGIIPAAMAWAQRYGDGSDSGSSFAPEALPGGRLTLIGMIAAATAVVGVESWDRLVGLG